MLSYRLTFMLGAGYIYLQQQKKKNNNNKGRFGLSQLCKKEMNKGVDKLLMNLQDDDVGLNGNIRYSFNNFLRVSSEDFQKLICLVGLGIRKKH